MKNSAFSYKFFRRHFTPLLCLALSGTAFLLILLVVVSSPKFSFPRQNFQKNASGTPIFSVVEKLSEQESLRDSEPLFLPTEYNSKEIGLAPELVVSPEEISGFGRISVLDGFFDGIADRREIVSFPSFDVLREKILDWQETRTFGESAGTPAKISSGEPKMRLEVYDEKGAFVAKAELERTFVSDGKILEAPVEIQCYGVPEDRRFVISQSSGDADFDMETLNIVREWMLRNVHENGVFSVTLAR